MCLEIYIKYMCKKDLALNILWWLICHKTSFSWFLLVQSQTLTPVSIHLIFIYFVVHFLFSRYIALSFISWSFDVFLCLPICFNVWLTHSYIFAPNFRNSWPRTTNVFLRTSVSLKEFYDPFHCFNGEYFCWIHCCLSIKYTRSKSFGNA